MSYGVKTQYLALPVVPAQKSREHHGSLVISPTVMIPISRIILLVIVRGRNADHFHRLGFDPGISRFLLIS